MLGKSLEESAICPLGWCFFQDSVICSWKICMSCINAKCSDQHWRSPDDSFGSKWSFLPEFLSFTEYTAFLCIGMYFPLSSLGVGEEKEGWFFKPQLNQAKPGKEPLDWGKGKGAWIGNFSIWKLVYQFYWIFLEIKAQVFSSWKCTDFSRNSGRSWTNGLHEWYDSIVAIIYSQLIFLLRWTEELACEEIVTWTWQSVCYIAQKVVQCTWRDLCQICEFHWWWQWWNVSDFKTPLWP